MPTIVYTVQPGDTLWSIAQKYNTTVNDLARYNGIATPNEIFAGQTLRIFMRDYRLPAGMWCKAAILYSELPTTFKLLWNN